MSDHPNTLALGFLWEGLKRSQKGDALDGERQSGGKARRKKAMVVEKRTFPQDGRKRATLPLLSSRTFESLLQEEVLKSEKIMTLTIQKPPCRISA